MKDNYGKYLYVLTIVLSVLFSNSALQASNSNLASVVKELGESVAELSRTLSSTPANTTSGPGGAEEAQKSGISPEKATVQQYFLDKLKIAASQYQQGQERSGVQQWRSALDYAGKNHVLIGGDNHYALPPVFVLEKLPLDQCILYAAAVLRQQMVFDAMGGPLLPLSVGTLLPWSSKQLFPAVYSFRSNDLGGVEGYFSRS